MSLTRTLNQPIGQALVELFAIRSTTTSRRPFPGGVVSQPAGPSPAGATTTFGTGTLTAGTLVRSTPSGPSTGPRGPETFALTGVVDAPGVYRLRIELEAITSRIAPKVVVDLHQVTDLHPECISMLMLHAHRAREQAGSLVVIPPSDGTARNSLEHVGLLAAA